MSLLDQTSNQYLGPDLIIDFSCRVEKFLLPSILTSLIVEAVPSSILISSSIKLSAEKPQ